MSARPDFFIAGAAKCGTTALFEYLSQHPSVFMPPLKEPKFFCPDLKTTGGVYDSAEYQKLFDAASAGCATGEASAMYLYSAVAIERIMAHNPLARIVVMLRYPVDAAHSLHAARWSHGHENIEDFEQAWRAQDARLAGKQLPPHWPDPQTLQYGAMYRYAAQVRRVLAHVPPAQRHFIVYEEFFADAVAAYSELLTFLGLAPDPRAVFPVVNPSLGPKSRSLDTWLRRPPRWLEALYAPLRPVSRAVGIRPVEWARQLNSEPRARSGLHPAFRAELDRYFADDIAELEGLLGRRLWSEASNSSNASGRT